jgi:hypothetical protein
MVQGVWLVKVYEVCPKAVYYLGNDEWTDRANARRFTSRQAARQAAAKHDDAVVVRLKARAAAPILIPAGVEATITMGPMATDEDPCGITVRGRFADVAMGGHLTVVFQDKEGKRASSGGDLKHDKLVVARGGPR